MNQKPYLRSKHNIPALPSASSIEDILEHFITSSGQYSLLLSQTQNNILKQWQFNKISFLLAASCFYLFVCVWLPSLLLDNASFGFWVLGYHFARRVQHKIKKSFELRFNVILFQVDVLWFF